MCSHVAKPLAKDVHERRLGGVGSRHQAHLGIELARAVVIDGVVFGQLVALTFFGNDVQELRPLQFLDVFQGWNEGFQIVAVNGADVVETKLLKQSSGHHHAFGMLFKAFGQFKQGGRTL